MSKIYRKKDLLESKSSKVSELEEEDLVELVGEKGAKIQGSEKIDQSDKVTSSKGTTDDVIHTKTGSQSMKYLGGRSYMSDVDGDEKSLGEVANDKMKGVLEDIFTKKNFDRDVLDKVKYTDGIPEIDLIKEKHPVLVRKIAHIKGLIDKDEVSGEEKAIMLNTLLSTNLTDIPSEYKKELSRKLGY